MTHASKIWTAITAVLAVTTVVSVVTDNRTAELEAPQTDELDEFVTV